MKKLMFAVLAMVGLKSTEQVVNEQGVTAEKVNDVRDNLMGGYQRQTLSAANQIQSFVKSQSNRVSNDMKLVNYQKQVVNGFNHKLIFEGKDGKRREIIVYEDIEGQLKIEDFGEEEM